eukprot:GHVP01032224.1.p1 GENE.GHVP01032224.1~~GHVP01032224.1.p1  ORF type:complete len:112 (-),score=14.93 GHVP01032224.1:30-365(-)
MGEQNTTRYDSAPKLRSVAGPDSKERERPSSGKPKDHSYPEFGSKDLRKSHQISSVKTCPDLMKHQSNQAGFAKDRNTMDQLLHLMLLGDKARKEGKPLFAPWIFEKLSTQ